MDNKALYNLGGAATGPLTAEIIAGLIKKFMPNTTDDQLKMYTAGGCGLLAYFLPKIVGTKMAKSELTLALQYSLASGAGYAYHSKMAEWGAKAAKMLGGTGTPVINGLPAGANMGALPENGNYQIPQYVQNLMIPSTPFVELPPTQEQNASYSNEGLTTVLDNK